MNTTPGELYILGIVISVLFSLLGIRYLLSKENDKKLFSITCLFFAFISWQVIIQLSYYDIVFGYGTYNVGNFITEIIEIAITFIKYLCIGGIAAGLVIIGLNKDVSTKLQTKLKNIKLEYKKKAEIEEVKEEYKPIQKITTKRIVKKSINPETKKVKTKIKNDE